MTGYIALLYQNTAQERNASYFETNITEIHNKISKRYGLYRQSLQGGLGLFKSSKSVERAEWNSYVETLNIAQGLPGINGVGFIEHVWQEDLNYFIEQTRLDDKPDFINHPETSFEDKFIIKYIYPEDTNKQAIGLDIGFEENRRSAAERARDTGRSALTKRIELVQDSVKRPGFLLLLPLYQNKVSVETVAQKRQNILGWVYAPFIGDNFFHDLITPDIDFNVYDGTSISEARLIFSAIEEGRPYKEDYQRVKEISVSGEVWTVLYRANENFIPPSNENISIIVGIIGGIFSLLTYALLIILTSQKDRIREVVEEKTFQLKDSEDFLSLIMNTIPDIVFVKDRDFKIVRANQAMLNMFPPEKRDQVIGYTGIETFTEEEASIFLEQDKIAFENGISQIQETLELYDGKIVHLYTTKVRFTDKNSNEYIMGIGRNVTELIDVQKNLEEKVVQRTKKFEEQKTLAEKAGKAKEEFLANMSHELRTPLNSILGLIKIILDEGELSQEQAEMLKIIDKSSYSLLRTVNDILDISKIEAGKIIIEKKPFNLPGLIHSLVEMVKPLASQKGLELRPNINISEAIFVLADEHRITRIINNIIGNAVKYTQKGHIELNFDLEEKEEGTVLFTFKATDTGIGISEDNIDKIFDKFAQAETSTERLYGGTGLGLSITKELIELMSGRITVESELDKGTSFTIEIPLEVANEEERHEQASDNTEQVTKRRASHHKISLDKAKILVVEDHEFNQIFIEKMLKRMGNKSFKTVHNGLEASSAFKGGGYDLVLMDCHMPKMNGFEATKAIRNFEEFMGVESLVPIIAMTADVMPGTRERCIEAGMDDYISKPIDEAVLKEKIAEWFTLPSLPKKKTTKKKNVKNNDFDLSLLKEYSEDDHEVQRELVSVFYKKSSADIKTLKKLSLGEGGNELWQETSHSLKGSALYIGAHALAALCAQSQEAKDQSLEEKKELYNKINTEHKKLLSFLKDSDLL